MLKVNPNIPSNQPNLTVIQQLTDALQEKIAERNRLAMSQDPFEQRQAEAMQAEIMRIDRLLSDARKLEPKTGGGYPLPPTQPQTGGGYPIPPSQPQTGGPGPLPPGTTPVRKIPRYIVRMSPAWARAQTAAGKKPEDEIKKLIPPGANYTIQGI